MVKREDGRELTPATAAGNGSKVLCLALLVGLIGAAVYGNTILNGFVWDDRAQVLENPWLTSFRYLPQIFSSNAWAFAGAGKYQVSYYRPMMHVFYLLTNKAFGLAPWGFHLVNIVIHALNSGLVFLIAVKLLRRLAAGDSTRAVSAAFLGALLFAVHPVHTEVVAWAAGIPDLSCSLFFLLAFYLYMEKERRGSWAEAGSVFFFFLSTLCKEPGFTLPAVLFAYDLAVSRSWSLPRLVRNYAPYLAVAAVSLVMRFQALKGFAPAIPHADLTPYQCVINVFPIFLDYLLACIAPLGLSFIHVFHPISSMAGVQAVAGLACLLLYLAALWLAWRKQRATFVALVLLIVPLLPVFYIRALPYPFAERYLYLPLAGVALLVAIGVAKLGNLRQAWLPAVGALSLVLVLFSAETFVRNGVWQSDLTLWLDTVRSAPDDALSRGELGHALIKAGRVDEGIDQYRSALALREEDAGMHNHLGTAYLRSGRVDEAIAEFRRSIALKGNDVDSHNNLGSAYLAKGMADKAAKEFEVVLALAPDSAETLNNLGLAYKSLNRLDDAVNCYQAALRLRPDVGGLHYNLARVYEMKGLREQAAREMRMAQQLQRPQ